MSDLCTLALRPNYIGRGIGANVIAWIKEHIRAEGKARFRLDCIATNQRLRSWYEQQGFQYCEAKRTGSYLLALYQLDLNPTSGSLQPFAAGHRPSAAGSRSST